MEKLYTTKQLEELLKVDRITIYRMLNDDRLNGVKVGGQWRFTQSEIDRLLGEEQVAEEVVVETVSDFPTCCMRNMQDMFAGIIGIGAITVTLHGTLLTEPSFSSPFCEMLLSSEVGAKACKQFWLEIISSPDTGYQKCHAGLNYRRTAIFSNNTPIAWFIAGQFYLEPPLEEKRKKTVERLAKSYNIPEKTLLDASRKIPVLTEQQKKQVLEWAPKVAGNLESLISERAQLLNRLRKISELSSI
jgi:excisionase family DNA binding protein